MENGPTARGGGFYHMNVNGNPVRMVAARSYNSKFTIRGAAASFWAHVICQKEAGEKRKMLKRKVVLSLPLEMIS